MTKNATKTTNVSVEVIETTAPKKAKTTAINGKESKISQDVVRNRKKLLNTAVRSIQKDITSIKQKYISIGIGLNEIKRLNLHTDEGYTNFYDFCKDYFQMEKSAVSRCMNVLERFADQQNECLEEKWKEYSYTQLCEMVSMDEKELEKVESKMTVKEIRQVKKSAKVASTQPPEKNTLTYEKLLEMTGSEQTKALKDATAKKQIVLYLIDEKTGKMVAENAWASVLMTEKIEKSSGGGEIIVIRANCQNIK